MGILRGVELAQIEPLIEIIISSGLETIEITMNTENAQQLIRKIVKLCRGKLMLGAGTVLNMHSLKTAIGAGAGFIVTPVFIKDVVGYCVKNKIPVFPGALTPQEIYRAWCAGATMVKVFPAKFFGPEYFREIKGPFGDIGLLACGGVTPQNLQRYFENGANAAAFGGNVFKKEWLLSGDFVRIGRAIKAYLGNLKFRLNKDDKI